MSIRASLAAVLVLIGTAGPALAANNNQADDAAAVLGGVLCIAIPLVAIVIKVLIVVFIVTDARKRGMDPTIYVVAEIFLGIFLGLIIYLCSREPIQEPPRYARDYDGDEDDDDTPRRSRRYRDRDEDDYDRDRRRDWDY